MKPTIQEAVAKLNELYLNSGREDAMPIAKTIWDKIHAGERIEYLSGAGYFLSGGSSIAVGLDENFQEGFKHGIGLLLRHSNLWPAIHDLKGIGIMITEEFSQDAFKQGKDASLFFMAKQGFGYRSLMESLGIDSIETLLICGAAVPHSIDEAEAIFSLYEPQRVVLVDYRSELVELVKLSHPHVESYHGDFSNPSSLAKVPEFDVAVGDLLFNWNEDRNERTFGYFVDMMTGIASRMKKSSNSAILVAEKAHVMEAIRSLPSEVIEPLLERGLEAGHFTDTLTAGQPFEIMMALMARPYTGELFLDDQSGLMAVTYSGN